MAAATKKKSDKIAVTKIEIEIGRKVISLTPDEMQELRDILDATFPKETTKTVYVPGAPIIIREPAYPQWPYRRWNEPVWVGGPTLTSTGSTANDSYTSSTLRLSCNSQA